MEYVMNKFLIGVLIFSFAGTVLSKSEDRGGFRNLKWQDSISKYKNTMRLTSEKGNAKKFYVIDNDDMLLGKIKLSSITYIFNKNKFSSVALQTEQSKSNLKQVVLELKKTFGEPYYSNKYINKYRWKNDTTEVFLKCRASSHKCSIKYNAVLKKQRR